MTLIFRGTHTDAGFKNQGPLRILFFPIGNFLSYGDDPEVLGGKVV